MIKFITLIWSTLLLASWVLAYPIDLAIPDTGDDGVELDRQTWQADGDPLVVGRPEDGLWRAVGLRYLATPLQLDRHVEFARLRFSAKAGVISDSLRVTISGVLEPDGRPFSQERRPSSLPRGQASSNLLLREAWRDGGANQLFYYSDDISAIINEIIQQPDWGLAGEGILLCLEGDEQPGGGANYVRFSACQPLRWPVTLQVCRNLEETFTAHEIVGRPTDSSVTVNFASLVALEVYVEYGAAGFDQQTALETVPADRPHDIALTGLPADTRCCYRLRYRRAGSHDDFQTGETRHFRTQRAQGAEFVFTVQADSHIWESWAKADPDDDEMKLYEQTIGNARADDPDFHCSMGDYSMTEYSQTLQHAMDRYQVQRPFLDRMLHSVPLYLVIVNHEGELGYYHVQGDPMPTWAEMARRAYVPNPYPDGFYQGCPDASQDGTGLRESYYSWEWGDALFVVLDPYWYTLERPFHNAVPSEGGGWAWTLGREQYDWLHGVLDGSDRRWKIVLLHHLVGGVDHGNSAYGRGGIETVDFEIAAKPSFEWGGEGATGLSEFSCRRPDFAHGPIHDLLVAGGVSVVVKGHDHFYARQELDGIVYLTVPQPQERLYQSGAMEAGEYTEGVLLPNAGHVRFRVSPTQLRLDYVRAYLPGEGVNGEVADSRLLGCEVAAAAWRPLPVRLQITPNPADANVRIRPLGGATGPDASEVCIYNVAGRLVQRLAPDRDGQFIWTRRDAGGRPVPSGLYFATWRQAGRSVTGRLTVIR